jgi:hypothetical protein
LLGGWILKRGAPRLLPVEFNDGFAITKLSVEHLPLVPERGLRISASPAKIKAVLREITPLSGLIPPGLICAGAVLHARWVPENADAKYSIPITICCNTNAGLFARVVFRYPFDELNELLKIEMAEKWHDRDEYFLGTYALNKRIWFNSLDVKSIMQSDEGAGSPLLLAIHATGRLRYNVEDGIIDATITAKVKSLDGKITLTPEPHKNGIGFKFDGVIERLDVSAKRMAPWLEHKLGRELRRSLEHSLNKRKRLRQFAKIRLPYWVPLDTVLDIELTQE